MLIYQPAKIGDEVAYYIKRRTCAAGYADAGGWMQVRRAGIVQGWRDGKVIVLHKAGYTELVADADLYLIE